MGGLFSTFGSSALPDIFIDLKSVQPRDDSEKASYDLFYHNAVEQANGIIQNFSSYEDAQRLATLSISDPTPENKENAWQAILPNIKTQMSLYTFSKTIADQLATVIGSIVSFDQKTTAEFFGEHQIQIKMMAEGFDILIQLDSQVLMKPKLLNDLAFFRRNAQSRNDDGSLDDLIENSNLSTVFWATPNPFVSAVVQVINTKYNGNQDQMDKVLATLGAVIDVCTGMMVKHSDMDDQLKVLCLRCITCALLMYDGLCPTGAFSNVRFHLKEAADQLAGYTPKQGQLINFLRFSSKHYNDPTTDPHVKQVLEA